MRQKGDFAKINGKYWEILDIVEEVQHLENSIDMYWRIEKIAWENNEFLLRLCYYKIEGAREKFSDRPPAIDPKILEVLLSKARAKKFIN